MRYNYEMTKVTMCSRHLSYVKNIQKTEKVSEKINNLKYVYKEIKKS